MRTRLWLVALTGLASAGGCAATPVPAPVITPAKAPAVNSAMEVRLQVGQTAPVDGAEFQITFDAVEGDSRCAKGAQCVWEGSATVRLSVTGAAGTQTLVLQTSPRAGPEVATHDGWAIRVVALEPQPIEGREIAQSGYVATLRLQHGTAGLATH